LVRKQLAINATPELSYEAHRCLCQGAVSYLGFPGVTEVGFLDVTTSAVNRATWTDPTPELVDCHQVVSAPTSPIIGSEQAAVWLFVPMLESNQGRENNGYFPAAKDYAEGIDC
jgi:hypothetical protein